MFFLVLIPIIVLAAIDSPVDRAAAGGIVPILGDLYGWQVIE